MSASDGADQTRIGILADPVGGVGDPTRNGEPYGEMGLVTQEDKLVPFDHGDQTGGPIDKQAGNTPGGKRDTRGDGLSGGTTNTTTTSSPTPVVDLLKIQVISLSFSYWATAISGVPKQTLAAVISPDPLNNGDALTSSLKLTVLKLLGEFSWVVVHI